MKKTYVLDTNVLLSNPMALYSFDEHDVVIPEAVLEELDNKKTGNKQININAREVARQLYALKNSFENEDRTLFEGVALKNGGTLYVELESELKNEVNLPQSWDSSKRDNDILRTCLTLKEQGKENVVLVTKDIFLGIKADSLGIVNEDYRTDAVVSLSEQYTGHMDLTLTEDEFNNYITRGYVEVNKAYKVVCTDNSYEEVHEFETYPNQFITIHNANNYFKQTMLGKVDFNGELICALKYQAKPYGVIPRNAQQQFMIEALLAPVEEIPLVVIKGPAGSAKTFMALACGLEKVMEQRDYRKILVCRPNITMDEELGFLPGTEGEKIAPLMRPIYDNLEVLVDSDFDSRTSNEEELQDKVEEVFDRKAIDMQSVGYLRGRSIENQWIILDESQNLSARQAEAIVTRAGFKTKVIFCGDPMQIDNEYVNERTNGLSYIAENMKGSTKMAVITTDEGDIVRSDLAKEAVKYLQSKKNDKFEE